MNLCSNKTKRTTETITRTFTKIIIISNKAITCRTIKKMILLIKRLMEMFIIKINKMRLIRIKLKIIVKTLKTTIILRIVLKKFNKKKKLYFIF